MYFARYLLSSSAIVLSSPAMCLAVTRELFFLEASEMQIDRRSVGISVVLSVLIYVTVLELSVWCQKKRFAANL